MTTQVRLGPSYEVIVQCRYTKPTRRIILVELTYVTPDDPNPNDDFGLGCGAGTTGWAPRTHTFRLAGQDSWSIASFYDPYSILTARDVSAFKQVTKQLLATAPQLAHACTLRLTPRPLRAPYRLTVTTGDTRSTGTFVVRGTPDVKTHLATIVSAEMPLLTLVLRNGTTAARFTLKMKKGLTYGGQQPVNGTRATFLVEVTASNLPSCRRHASGELTISTLPSLALRICGRAFVTRHVIAAIEPIS